MTSTTAQIVRGIEPAIAVDLRTFQHQACHFVHALQRFQTLREEHHIRFMHWCHW